MIRSVVVLSVAFAGATAAQDTPRLDPRDPKAPVPAVPYRSAFEGYRSYAEQELVPWRKANEEVGAAGAHAGQQAGQRAGQAAPGKPSAASAGAKPPVDEGHGDHK